jgi:hypothetical protein
VQDRDQAGSSEVNLTPNHPLQHTRRKRHAAERKRSDHQSSLLPIRSKIPHVKVATGTVVGGKVVVEGEVLTERATVSVLLRDEQETLELTAADEAELLESISEIERGDFITGDELLKRLARFG